MIARNSSRAAEPSASLAGRSHVCEGICGRHGRNPDVIWPSATFLQAASASRIEHDDQKSSSRKQVVAEIEKYGGKVSSRRRLSRSSSNSSLGFRVRRFADAFAWQSRRNIGPNDMEVSLYSEGLTGLTNLGGLRA